MNIIYFIYKRINYYNIIIIIICCPPIYNIFILLCITDKYAVSYNVSSNCCFYIFIVKIYYSFYKYIFIELIFNNI